MPETSARARMRGLDAGSACHRDTILSAMKVR